MSGGRGALMLGAATLVLAGGLGSVAVVVIGVGLTLAGAGAVAWRRLIAERAAVERTIVGGPFVEGDLLRVQARLRIRRGLPSIGELHVAAGSSEVVVPLRRSRTVEGAVGPLRRGRFTIGPVSLRLGDPLGLVRLDRQLEGGPVVTVRPRVPVLDELFSDHGTRRIGGTRAFLRRPSGFEARGVREYQDGEPLRSIHWPTTARTGRLMVRELDDSARDDVLVVLDANADVDPGPPGASSLDEAVRVAGALARAHVARGRVVSLVLAGSVITRIRVRSLDADWDSALDALSLVEAARGADLPPVASLARTAGADLVVVTSRPPSAWSNALASVAGAGRRLTLVAIDAPTYADGRPSGTDQATLRFASEGVAVMWVRRGDDLQVVLTGRGERAAVGG